MKRRLRIIGVIIIIFTLIMIIYKPYEIIIKKIFKLEHSEYVYKYSEEYNIDPYLIFAIIKTESNFHKNVESRSGAIGLMQLMESTAIEMANEIGEDIPVKEALYNSDTNIKIGTKYFAYLLKHYNNNQLLAIAAYNAGMGNVDKWIKEGTIKEDSSDIENIPYKETNNYVRKVVRNYKIYKSLYDK